MVDMDLVVIFGGIFLTTVGFQVARAVARRVESRSVGRADLGEIRARLAAIETAVDSIAIEVERVAEAQRFVAQLQAGRSEGAPAAHSPVRKDLPES